jgi:hypothetical protein
MKKKQLCSIILLTMLMISFTFTPSSLTTPLVSAKPLKDTISNLLLLVDGSHLQTYATGLVAYGPRRAEVYQSFIDDQCTYSGVDYPKSTIEMSSDYVKNQFLAMGYSESQITMENVPNGLGSWGHNVYVTKIGTAYPNYFVEFGGHIDTQPGTPGGNDNASGAASVMELARVLKDYPNRYSMRFALWVAEEITVPGPGADYHVKQALLRGEKIKAGLNIDSTGWGDTPVGGVPTYMNEVWYNDAESSRIDDLFNSVRTEYSIPIGFRKTLATITSDERGYWMNGQTAVTSVGGWSTYHPNFHGCGDTVANIDFTNTLYATRQNLAVGLKLDAEILPPTLTLTVSPTTVPANSTSTVTATATVRAPDGSPLVGETVTFSTSGDVTFGAVIDHQDGTYTTIVTASGTSGDETITATDGVVSATAILHESLYCPGYCFYDTLASDFSTGTPGTSYISQTADGEVILMPAVGTEFSGTGLPTDWPVAAYGTGSPSSVVSDGWLALDGALILSNTYYAPGRSMEFAATFTGGQWQAVGLGADFVDPPWATFETTQAGNGVYASTSKKTDLVYSESSFGTTHRFRIDWTASGANYYMDGNLVASHTSSLSSTMRIGLGDYNQGNQVLYVDWLRMSPYASSGTFTSRILDGAGPVNWGLISWAASSPAGTSVTVSVRSGNTPAIDGTWTEFSPVTNNNTINVHARYLQYQAVLTSTNPDVTPSLSEITIRYSPESIGPATKLGFIVQPGGTSAGLPFSNQPVIAVQDSSGYTIVDDNSTQINLAIGNNPSVGVLACNTNPVTVVNGVAIFSGCEIDKAGSGYTLTGAPVSGSLTTAISTPFNITLPAPASISLTLNPTTVIADGTSPVTATATTRDAEGNPLSGQNVSFASNGDVSFGNVTDLGNGTYSAIITASRTPGDEIITAAVNTLSNTAILHETPNCPGTCFMNSTADDFLSGTHGSATYVSETDDGEVILSPSVGEEFYGPNLPSDWPVVPYGTGSASAVISNGWLTMDGALILSNTSYTPGTTGRSLEFSATYTGGAYQSMGLGANWTSPPWAAFDTTGAGTGVYANTSGTTALALPATSFGTIHRYRIDWTPTGVNYYLDGNLVVAHSPISTGMHLGISDHDAGSQVFHVDWVRMSPYASSGSYLSRVFDAYDAAQWGVASWTADIPAGTGITISIRSGNTPIPDESWTGWSEILNGVSIGRTARYLQYQAELTSDNSVITPALKNICFSYTDTTTPTIINRSPLPGATGVLTSATITVDFSEPMDPASITASSFNLHAVGSPSVIPATISYSGVTATLTPLAPLLPLTSYMVTVGSSVSDLHGNHLGSEIAWNFSTRATILVTSASDFKTGATLEGTYLSQTNNGEVILKPTLGAEFTETTLPSEGWSTPQGYNCSGTGSAVVENGQLSLNCRILGSTSGFTAGHSLEIKATFISGNPYQMAGFWNYTGSPWRAFDLSNPSAGTLLEAASSAPGISFNITGNPIGSPHTYRIDWTTVGFALYVDGTSVGSLPAESSSMKVALADYGLNSNEANNLRVDWVRMTPYASSGTYTSGIYDALQTVKWTDLTATAIIPGGTILTFETRTTDDLANWPTTWQSVNSPITSPDGRYIQFRANFTTQNTNITPTLEDVTLTYSPHPTGVDLNYLRAYRDPGGVQLTWETVNEATLAGFNLYRREPGGKFEQVNAELIPPARGGQPEGFAYLYLDEGAQPGLRYEYRLEAIENTLEVGSSALVAYFPYTLMLPVVTH